MKRLIFLLCFILFASPALAGSWNGAAITKFNGVTVTKVCNGLVTLAAACTTPTNGDRFNQGWEVGESTTGWTKTAASDPEVSDDAATLPGTPPTGACAKGYRASSTGTLLKDTYNRGAADTSTYFRFSLYVDSHSIGSFSYAFIFIAGSNTDATQTLGGVRLKNNGGTLQLVGSSAANVSTGINIAVDTWYTVTGYVEKSTTENANWISLDGGSTRDTWTATNVINNCQYLHVGVLTASRTADVYFGHVQGDSNGF